MKALSSLALLMVVSGLQAQGLGGIARVKEKVEVQNLVRQIVISYKVHETTNSRGPARLEDLGPDISRNGKIVEALKSGDLKVVWGLKLNAPAETVVVYETKADMSGRRIVGMGDGSVQELDEAAFKKLVK